jgi:urease accessory protein
MCAAISRSDALRAASPARSWSDGAARIAVIGIDGTTRLRDLYQSDPCRVLFPRPAAGAPLEGIIITTSGGIVGGDRISLEIEAGDGSVVTMTTQAAEKIYRSSGATSQMNISVAVGEEAVLEWMPQETILFDGARLRRSIAIDVASSARLLCGEFIVFGRRARGETFTHGFLHDSWRINQDDRLLWADALHLADDIEAIMVRPISFDGAAAHGTMIYHGHDAETHLETARALLKEAESGKCVAAATCLGSLLIMRFLGTDAADTRRTITGFWSSFRDTVLDLPARLPRVWEA